MKWTERKVGYAVMHHLMQRAAIVVPNCSWTGSEADLLVVTNDLRVIDVEIKVDRGDLKADGAKEKWVQRSHYRKEPRGTWSVHDRRILWPDKVWKHYYVMPSAVWDDSLYEYISPSSGVIVIKSTAAASHSSVMRVIRAAKPNRGCARIEPADAFNIGRLANLRMWDRVMKTTGSATIGQVKVSSEFVRGVRSGFAPDEAYSAMMKSVIVLDTNHDFLNDTVIYTVHCPDFKPVAPGEPLPTYSWVFTGNSHGKWENVI